MQKERHENQVAQLKLLVWPREMGDQLEQLDIPLSLSRQVLSSRLCTRGVCSQGVFALGAQTKIFGKYAPLQITRLSVLIQIVALRALFTALYTSLESGISPQPPPGQVHPNLPHLIAKYRPDVHWGPRADPPRPWYRWGRGPGQGRRPPASGSRLYRTLSFPQILGQLLKCWINIIDHTNINNY